MNIRLHRFMTWGIFIFFLFIAANQVYSGIPQWYKQYEMGLKAMESGDYQKAVGHFLKALELRPKDKKKTRAYGAVFIKYYPNRELGICYFHLGYIEEARKYLEKSMRTAPSRRAREYLERIHAGDVPKTRQPLATKSGTENFPPPSTTATRPESKPETASSEPLIGERMSLAVLQFDTKDISGELGSVDLIDKLITAFVNTGRFRVIERAQLEKILEEQKLGMSGILDASTAAKIGRGIGVDAVAIGSVARSGNSMSVDARIIDTETAAIIVAKDAYANGLSIQQLNQMILELAEKIRKALPIVHGVVINVVGDQVTVDFGSRKGVKKGMKCIIYEEGENIVHPITGKIIGKMINEKCEIQLTEVFDEYSLGMVIREKKGRPQKLDKVIVK